VVGKTNQHESQSNNQSLAVTSEIHLKVFGTVAFLATSFVRFRQGDLKEQTKTWFVAGLDYFLQINIGRGLLFFVFRSS